MFKESLKKSASGKLIDRVVAWRDHGAMNSDEATGGRVVVEADISVTEQELWRERLDRLLLLVSDPIAKGDLFDPRSGTGVLVRIAERDFVVTAGHNLRDMRKDDLTLVFRHPNLTLPAMPGKDVREWWFDLGYGEAPDVGVLELESDRQSIWRHYEPIHLDSFARWEDIDESTRVIVAGFPAAKQVISESEASMTLPTEKTALRHSVKSTAISKVTRIRRDITSNPHEPSDGRCFHVGWEKYAPAADAVRLERIAPHGVSGGPVFTIDGSFRYIGITRSTFDDRALLCEPVREALRLLVDHPDPLLREQVQATISRLTV